MLLGEYAHTIDDKNRLTLPAKFRESFADGGVVTRGLDGCLYLYAGEDWDSSSPAARRARPAQRGGAADEALLLLRREPRRSPTSRADHASRRAARARGSAARSSSPGSTTTWRSGTAPPGAST